MTLPARTTLSAAIVDALEGVTADNGARTWIGRKVFVGLRQVNDTEAPCCVLTPGPEIPAADAGMSGHVQIAYSISGYVNRRDTRADEYTADPCAEFALIDAIIEDVREAIEGEGCVLSDQALSVVYQGAEPHYQDGAGELVGATLRYLITTPYIDFIPGQ